MICPKCGNWMAFQGELLDPDRGRYQCDCGHETGRVFKNEKRPAGWGQQTAKEKVNRRNYTMGGITDGNHRAG